MKRYTTPLHRFLARRSAARKAARQAALCRRIDRQFTLCETDTVGHVCQRLDAMRQTAARMALKHPELIV